MNKQGCLHYHCETA